ncbi:hypothetical protein LTR53_002952 [Teratosphaeriaceae sp. CCFEE 6253]|nr:hypothetical protein LTR53_002952 [Teratosphaeriaceae sp. CCFEE 6253]
MGMRYKGFVAATVAAALLGALPLVAGHGDHDMGAGMSANGTTAVPASSPTDGYHDHPTNYFRHAHYRGWMAAHIGLMVFAWIFTMPIAIMLSTARSRYHIPAQVLFHILNGLGMFTGFVYNHATPDLYEGNVHHTTGWIVSSFTIVWTLTSLYTAYGEYWSKRGATAQRSSPRTNTSRYSMLPHYSDATDSMRWSGDSAMGSSRQNSAESISKLEDAEDAANDNDDGDDGEEAEKRGFLRHGVFDRFLSRHKLLLLAGFFALCTGFVVYGGVGRSRQIFSLAAHFVKGGIFVWYGVLTLGRWMGAFSEFGWAWNIRPEYPIVARWKTRVPSAEFVESFVIWLYGASNVFLEHLNNWGGEWHPQDFEHVSITALFFGGGLLGMLIDSAWFRKQLNTSVAVQRSQDLQLTDASRFAAHSPESTADHVPDELWQEPKTYKVPLNPMPGLVIMILGIMMGAHEQDSMVSTMMHAQWGTLFFAFAIARATTYITLYLKPPTSHFPARPPSELVSAFCLMSGGLMFMVSAHDTIWAIETSGLDAMTIFTVAMGFTGVVMSWEVVCFAVKGWAVRKERLAAGKPLP